MSDILYSGDNLEILQTLESESVQMVYIDPPFNTGEIQSIARQRTVIDEDGNRKVIFETALSYGDTFDDYWSFLLPRLEEAWRLLKPSGTLYLHLDYREVHYARVVLDSVFGRSSFLNEIIWAYDYGGKSKSKWPTKHDNILVYVKTPGAYFYDSASVDREPYMAPGLAGKAKAELGKLPTDVWWHTIVPTQGSERTGYPTQKPEGILRRMVQASTREGDTVLDFFAGSGTAAAVAQKLNRRFITIDQNPESITICENRLGMKAVSLSRPA